MFRSSKSFTYKEHGEKKRRALPTIPFPHANLPSRQADQTVLRSSGTRTVANPPTTLVHAILQLSAATF